MVDTNVFSSRLVRGKLAEQYEPQLVGRPLLVSFVSDGEIRYGARKDG
jgi:predicted nucleic acid-binding protein